MFEKTRVMDLIYMKH